MNVRAATEADQAALRPLWEEFETEVPEPEGFEPETWEQQWGVLQQSLETGAVYVAEDEGELLGVLHLLPVERGVSHVEWAHVRPSARRRGVLTALLRESVGVMRARGARTISLEALTANELGLQAWRRLGFEVVEYYMAQAAETLEHRLAETPVGESRASTHVQSDDRASVERALAQFVPRLTDADVRASANGWMRIEAEPTDADRELQGRLATELSERLGAVVVALALERGAVVRFRVYERGRMVDEYLSVPTFYGALPKADELALAANPTLVARLTGADREELRRIARTATAPAELPPAPELYEQIARALGLEP